MTGRMIQKNNQAGPAYNYFGNFKSLKILRYLYLLALLICLVNRSVYNTKLKASERRKKFPLPFLQVCTTFQNLHIPLLQIPKLEALNFPSNPTLIHFSSVLRSRRRGKKKIPCSWWRGTEWILSKLPVNHS